MSNVAKDVSSATDDVVRTQRLELIDAEGVTRGLFTTTREGDVFLGLLGKNNKAGVSLFAKASGEAGMTIQVIGGADRIQILVRSSGEADLNLRDADGNMRVALGVSDEDGPMLGLFDEQGEVLWNARS